jgi:excisionase family DNA binding protein
MSETPLAGSAAEPFANQPDPQDQRTRDVGALVGEWLSWSEAAESLGIPVSKVRQLIKEHQLAALVPAPGAGQKIPAAFLDGREIVKGLPGLLTVLHDAGFSDHEIIEWVFTADPTLPGRPIDALRENRGSEVKRRAQAMF